MKIERPPRIGNVAFDEWMEKLWNAIYEDDISAELTWDPGSIADGDEVATNVEVTGAELGDYAIASFSLDVGDLVLDAQVTSSSYVSCVLSNNTGGAVDLSEGTLYVRVFRRTING